MPRARYLCAASLSSFLSAFAPPEACLAATHSSPLPATHLHVCHNTTSTHLHICHTTPPWETHEGYWRRCVELEGHGWGRWDWQVLRQVGVVDVVAGKVSVEVAPFLPCLPPHPVSVQVAPLLATHPS